MIHVFPVDLDPRRPTVLGLVHGDVGVAHEHGSRLTVSPFDRAMPTLRETKISPLGRTMGSRHRPDQTLGHLEASSSLVVVIGTGR